MNWRNIALVIVVFIAYFNLFQNNFVGDDLVLFQQSSFYQNLSNLKILFSPEFIVQLDPDQENMLGHTGCVSYRPITAISFFLDGLVWGEKAWGFHLTNILLHIMVCIALLQFLLKLFPYNKWNYLSVLFFAVHPIHVELMTTAGYRSDLLAALFVLMSLIAFFEYKVRQKYYLSVFSLVSLGFSMFSKETGLLGLFFIIIWQGKYFRLYWRWFLSAGVIGLLYLYSYFIVFPNATFPAAESIDWFVQLSVGISVFWQHLKSLFFPWMVKVLPSFYAPMISEFSWIDWFLFLSCLGVLGGLIRYLSKELKANIVMFGAVWFLIFYFPVSNIFPLPNPWAHRFLYLPSMGIILLCTTGFGEMLGVLTKNVSKTIRIFTVSFLVLAMASMCWPITRRYRTQESFLNSIFINFPDAWIALKGLSEQRLFANNKSVQIELLKRLIAEDRDNVFYSIKPPKFYLYNSLGVAYAYETDKAIEAFSQAIELNPSYVFALTNRAKAYLLNKKYKEAEQDLIKAVQINPTFYSAYVFAVHFNKEWPESEEIKKIVSQGKVHYPNDPIFNN